MGTGGLVPPPPTFAAGHDAAAACHDVLGCGGVAHGVEREHGGLERHLFVGDRAEAFTTRIYRVGKRFSGTRRRQQPEKPEALRSAGTLVPRQAE